MGLHVRRQSVVVTEPSSTFAGLASSPVRWQSIYRTRAIDPDAVAFVLDLYCINSPLQVSYEILGGLFRALRSGERDLTENRSRTSRYRPAACKAPRPGGCR